MSLSPFTPDVAVVILNWNGEHFLKQFLPSVIASTYASLKIYVADNGSTDDSVALLKNDFPQIKLLSIAENKGFTGGYNEAIQHVHEEYVVLLNSDIEVDPEWIQPAIDVFAANDNIAAVQPKILQFTEKNKFEYAGAAGGWIDRFGYPFSRGRIFDVLEEDKHQYDDEVEIFWATGAAMFIRKKIFFEAGGFDNYFFAHQEEIDLCWRIQLAGYKIKYCPNSIVYHVGAGTLSKENPQKTFLNFRNNLIMLYKNLSGWNTFYILLVRFFLDALSAWKNLLAGKPKFYYAVTRAHFGFFRWLLFKQNSSVFPSKKNGKPSGIYRGNIAWDHFVLGKKYFSEIVKK